MLGWRQIALLGLLLGWASLRKAATREPGRSRQLSQSKQLSQSRNQRGNGLVPLPLLAQIASSARKSLAPSAFLLTPRAEAREDLQEAVCLIYEDCGQLQSISCDEQDE